MTDQLFETGCAFCGKTDDVKQHHHDGLVYRCCAWPEHKNEPWWGEASKEIARRRALAVNPVAAHQPAHPEPVRVGDRVRGKTICNGELFTGIVEEVNHEYLGKRGPLVHDAQNRESYTLDPVTVEKLDSGTVDPFAEPCADCGRPITDKLNAYKRTHVVNGRNEYLPGTYHATCPAKPVEPARADPYAEHRRSIRGKFAGVGDYTAERLVLEQMVKRDATRKAMALDHLGNNSHALRVSKHSAGMDVRAKAKNRGKYGEPVSAFPYEEKWESAGWDSD
jgi:hypothetical protein